MYRCERCQRQVGPRVRQTELVLEARPKTYPPREKAKRERRSKKDDPNKTKRVWVGDPGGVGTETARVAKICPGCAANEA